MKASTLNFNSVLLGCLMALVGLYACGGQSATGSGFLSDYSKLQKNPNFEGSQIYFNPDKPLKNYSRFIVNPVQVKLSPLGAHRAADPAKVQEISQYAHQQFVSALQKGGYEIVNRPGPGTLILRSALTEVAPSGVKSRSVLMNISLGGASIEAEFIDSLSEEVVVAAIESQRGKITKTGTSQYDNARNVIDRWAERLSQRMDEEHETK